MRHIVGVVVVLCIGFLPALAQNPATGLPPFGSFQSAGFDTVNLQNLNTNFSIPIMSIPGRGTDFSFSVVYDSLLWTKVTVGSTTSWQPVTDPSDNPIWGWKKDIFGGATYFKKTTLTIKCPDSTWAPKTTWTNYSYRDVLGTQHGFTLTIVDNECLGTFTTTGSASASDGSGYYMNTANGGDFPVAISPGGLQSPSAGSVTDTNGNLITKIVVNSTENDWKDTAGHTVLKVITSTNSVQYQFQDTTGAYQTATLGLQSTNIKTNFACSGVVEYTGTANLPISLVLPNNKQYSFTYEPTPNAPGYYTGRVQRVILPTGGYYEFDYPGSNDSINCADGTVTSLNRTLNDGSSSAVWQFLRTGIVGSSGTTTITAPILPYDTAANQTTLFFDSNGFETTRKIYQGSSAGTPMRTIATGWATNGTPTVKKVILEDGSTQSEADTTYDDNGNLLQISEYDFGSGARGSLIRTTNFTYLSSAAYTSRNILNRVSSVIVKDASGATKYRQDVAYDETGYINSSCPTGATQHDDTNYGCAFTARGNPTTVTTYLDPVTPANGISKHFHYDSFGNVTQAALNCCQQKTWNYSSTTQYAYPDSIVSGPTGGPQLTVNLTYNPYTGQIATTTDENNQSMSFAYDFIKRLTTVTRPDNVQQTNAYNDTAQTVTTTIPVTNSAVKQTGYVDGLGRSIKRVTTDSSGTSYSIVEQQYDPLGRAYKTSNPHNSTAQYWTESRRDALGRMTVVIPPDGSATSNNTSYAYAANTTTVTDPASKQRRNYVDALGRLIRVDEPGSVGTSATSGTGSVTINGTLQSVTTSAAAPGTGSVTISGAVKQRRICDPDCHIVTDAGRVNITVNGFTATASYSRTTDTATTMATALANAFNSAPASPVTASVSSTTVNLTSKQSGASTNYPLSTSVSYNSEVFTSPSFTATKSGTTLTGGRDAVIVYDAGTVSITVNGFTKTVNYGQGSTSSTVASGLASAFNGDGTSPVTAGASGSTVNLVSKATGAATNYPLSASSMTTQTSYFGSPSFTTVPSGSNLTGGADAAPPGFNPPAITVYGYDVFDNLASVQQEGTTSDQTQWRTRSFVYDSLSRLKTATTPEAGSVGYLYNDFDLMTQRTDARGVVATYSYDALNRLYQISYDVGTTGVPATPTVTFTYGTNSALNNNGRLQTMTDGVGSETYSYDVLGQVTQLQKGISGTTYTLGYGYNLAGELSSLTYPSSRTVQQTYDNIGRLSTVASGATNYASSFGYSPASQVTGFNYGNGVTASFGYSPQRLQLQNISYSMGATTLFNLSYGYVQPNGGNNGEITQIIDNVQSGRTAAYSYDVFGRISTAATSGSTTYPQWGLSWTYDMYGNRLNQTVTAGTAPSNSLAVNANNQIVGYSYDANGNLTWDQVANYQYDAENRLLNYGNGGGSYSYDGKGMRVKKVAGGTTTVYVFSGSKVIAEYANGSLNKEYVYSGSRLLATIAGSTTTYHHADHLSVRLSTDSSGGKVGEQGHFPFGESWYAANSTTKWQFTSYERDSESGNDYAMARYHMNRVGRFSSPDLLGGSVIDPQSLNRYAYVANSPINAADPFGLELCLGSCEDESGGGGFSLNPALGPGDVLLDGSPVSGSLGQVALRTGFGVWGPVTTSIPGLGFAIPGARAGDGSISWSFSFQANWNGTTLTDAAIAEILGLPSESGGGFSQIQWPRPKKWPEERKMLQQRLRIRFKQPDVGCDNPSLKSALATASLTPPDVVNYVDTNSVSVKATVVDSAGTEFSAKATPNPFTKTQWTAPFIPGSDVQINWTFTGKATTPWYFDFKVSGVQQLECN